MMPDDNDTENTGSQFDELVGRVGALFAKQGLTPPSRLRAAAKHWLRLSHEEIVEVVRKHFAEHRRLYTCGSGDGYFYMIESAMRKAWQAKHPSVERAADEAERPRRRRAGGVRKIHSAGGLPDAIVEGGHAARLFRDEGGPVERPSGLVGYESAGEPIEDDEADA